MIKRGVLGLLTIFLAKKNLISKKLKDKLKIYVALISIAKIFITMFLKVMINNSSFKNECNKTNSRLFLQQDPKTIIQ